MLSRYAGPLRTLCRLAFAASILTVSVLSLLPGLQLPEAPLSDKIGHFIAYTAIAIFGLFGYRGGRATAAVLVGAIVLGLALEIGQSFVPGRSPEFLDAAVNTAGVLVGYLTVRRWLAPNGPVAVPRSGRTP